MTGDANENNAARAKTKVWELDAHGQAALILAESMLHALLERGVFTPEQALSVVSAAQEIQTEFARGARESQGRMQASRDLLATIADSLEHEM